MEVYAASEPSISVYDIGKLACNTTVKAWRGLRLESPREKQAYGRLEQETPH